jgi:phosphoglycerate dehydrogenase-like enzyme
MVPLEEWPALEWIQLASSGYEELLPLKLPQRGIRATNARGVFDVPIAEWCMAMMINLARDLREMIRNQEQGIWDRHVRFQREIRQMTVGFWGYGGFARQTARLAKAFGLNVKALTRNGAAVQRDIYRLSDTGDPGSALPDAIYPLENKQEFLSQLDFLILATPLDEKNRGMVGEAELKALPARAFVLNPARGPLIQEQALLRALSEGWIAGAALDTHYHYPMPPQHPLWKFPNVIMTPHISGSSLNPFFLERVWDLFSQNVDRFLAGQPLLNELTHGQLTAG